MDLLHQFLGSRYLKLSKNEKCLFDAYIFVQIYHELYEKYKMHCKKYWALIKDCCAKEDIMQENEFLEFIIKDIVSTEEYTLEGIANTLRMPIDVIYDLAAGINTDPSSVLWRKIIKLHSSVKRELYLELINKILSS